MSSLIKSENFKSRVTTSLFLLIICIVGLLTPKMIGFRIFFGIAGLIACFELIICSHNKMSIGEIVDDRIVIFEVAIIFFGAFTLSFYLYPEEILLVLVAAVANDTFAYIFGNLCHNMLFKNRPFPNTSPKKSWEGIIGGYVSSAILCFAFLVIWKYAHGMRNLEYMVFSYLELYFIILAPVFAILGDFFESFTKRFLGIKDSNEYIVNKKIPVLSHCEFLMRGHGGFADRIDSGVAVALFILLLKALPT